MAAGNRPAYASVASRPGCPAPSGIGRSVLHQHVLPANSICTAFSATATWTPAKENRYFFCAAQWIGSEYGFNTSINIWLSARRRSISPASRRLRIPRKKRNKAVINRDRQTTSRGYFFGSGLSTYFRRFGRPPCQSPVKRIMSASPDHPSGYAAEGCAMRCKLNHRVKRTLSETDQMNLHPSEHS